MTATVSDLVAPIAGYARRLHRVIGDGHHVASPLGAWLLLALAGPASEGQQRATLAKVLGCEIELAARTAAELLTSPHPLVAAAAAVWSHPGAVSQAWLTGLPATVQTGAVPDQAGADAWARRHSLGLIEKFPIAMSDAVYLVLATALATRVSWEHPFELAPASALGPASPWAGRLSRVLSAPAGHEVLIAVTPEAGDVAMHIASARGGLRVASVAAAPGVPPAGVLAAAYRIGCSRVAGVPVEQRSLFDLPLGESPLWTLREQIARAGRAERCTAVLPAWSARSDHDLGHPDLGFGAAKEALVGAQDPWQARQSAMARYSRTGFEAAAVTGLAAMLSMRAPGRVLARIADLRFAHPYAVVAVAEQGQYDHQAGAIRRGSWHGLPVFSAWVADPEEAAGQDDGQPA
jgi:hypothetical protein